MFLCFALLFLLTTGKAVDSSLLLSLYSPLNSSCKSGLIDGEDTFLFTGSVNATIVNIQTRPLIKYEVKRLNSSIFDGFCTVDFRKDICTPYQSTRCYCNSNQSSIFKIILNDTANILYSAREVRLSWLNGLNSPDISNIEYLPTVYPKANELLEVNGKSVNSHACQNLVEKPSSIKWCISNLKNITLTISSVVEHNISDSNCSTLSFSSDISLNDFNISIQEHEGCERQFSYSCFFIASTSTDSTITIASSPLDSTITIASSPPDSTITIAPQQSNTTCSPACIGVSVGHAACSALEIIITIIVMIILLEKDNLCYLVIASTSLTSLELIQAALVVVNAVSDIQCVCNTTIPMWGIMLFYQFTINTLIICVESIYLGYKSNCKTSTVFSMPWIFLIIIICIHSVIGIIALPFILLLKGCVFAPINSSSPLPGNTAMVEISCKDKDKSRNKNESPMQLSQDDQTSFNSNFGKRNHNIEDEIGVKIRSGLEPIKKMPKNSKKNKRKKRGMRPDNNVKDSTTGTQQENGN